MIPHKGNCPCWPSYFVYWLSVRGGAIAAIPVNSPEDFQVRRVDDRTVVAFGSSFL